MRATARRQLLGQSTRPLLVAMVAEAASLRAVEEVRGVQVQATEAPVEPLPAAARIAGDRADVPAGGHFTTPFLSMLDPQTADCAYRAFHTWDIDEDTRQGLVWKLRSISPRPDPAIDPLRIKALPPSDTGCISTAGSGGTTAVPRGSAEVTVPFQFEDGQTCSSAGVSMVRVELGDMTYVATASCASGQVRLSNVIEGSYAVRAFGLADDGTAVFDDFSSSVKTLTVTATDATLTTEPVTLTAAPAHLLLRWNFAFTSCSSVGIDRFVVALRRPPAADTLLEATLLCGLEGDGVDQYRRIPDPERRVVGSEPGEVSVQATAPNGTAVGSPVVIRFDAPGRGPQSG
jgi:hypothetical protein